MPWVFNYVTEPEYSKGKIEEYLSHLTEDDRKKFKFRLRIYLLAEGKIEDLFSWLQQ